MRTVIDVSVGKFVRPLAARLQVVEEGALEDVAVLKCDFSLALLYSCDELAFVHVARGEVMHAFAMFLILVIHAAVGLAVRAREAASENSGVLVGDGRRERRGGAGAHTALASYRRRTRPRICCHRRKCMCRDRPSCHCATRPRKWLRWGTSGRGIRSFPPQLAQPLSSAPLASLPYYLSQINKRCDGRVNLCRRLHRCRRTKTAHTVQL